MSNFSTCLSTHTDPRTHAHLTPQASRVFPSRRHTPPQVHSSAHRAPIISHVSWRANSVEKGVSCCRRQRINQAFSHFASLHTLCILNTSAERRPTLFRHPDESIKADVIYTRVCLHSGGHPAQTGAHASIINTRGKQGGG